MEEMEKTTSSTATPSLCLCDESDDVEETTTTSPKNDLIDDAFLKLEAYIESTQASIRSFKEQLNQAVDFATAELQKQVSDLAATVEAAISKAESAAQKLEGERAAQAKLCIQKQKAASDAILQGTITGAAECFTHKMETGFGYLDELTNKLKEAETVLKQGKQSAKKCTKGSMVKDPICLGKLAVKIAAKHTAIAAKSGLLVVKTTSFISTIGTALSACAGLRMATTATEIAVVIGKIAACTVTSPRAKR